MNAYTTYIAYRNKKETRGQLMRNWQTIGLGLIALAMGGVTRATLPSLTQELGYQIPRAVAFVTSKFQDMKPMPAAVPMVFSPLIDPEGNAITPVNTEFSLIVPKIGINTPVMPAVDPTNQEKYSEALQEGVAHAATSYFPNENGAVYIFSHSTNYEWFVEDLNAVFYLLKNLSEGDLIVLIYKGTEYTYQLTEKRVVSPESVSYMAPIEGKKMLILQTCWPPGSTTERLLVFADLIQTEKIK
jgi:LPXTG-site transpeptidase (sortase) family protein